MWKKAQSGVPQPGWPTAERPRLTVIVRGRGSVVAERVALHSPQPTSLHACTRTE